MVEAVTLNSSNEPESDYRDRQIALLRQEVARLHASEQRLLDFAKASTDWHWECDADLKLTFISDEFFEQTGLSREDVIGRRRDEIGLREDPNTVDWAAHLRRLTRRQPFRDFSYAVYDRTGATRHVQVSGVPVYDDNGAFQGYRGSTVDITAQVNARADAERLRQLLEGLLQHQPSAVAIRDLDGRFTVVNPRFAALVGRTPDDLIGYRAEEIFPPSIAELFLAEDAEVRERL
ncbi:MAG: PAS domain S-box protein, partial [Pseudomonadota bacterium]